MKWVVHNLTYKSTPEFIETAANCIDKAGSFEESNFTNSNLATKSILLGEGPVCKNADWTNRLKNTPESLGLLATVWGGETLARKDGSHRKRDVKSVPEIAIYAAFCNWILTNLTHEKNSWTDAENLKLFEDETNTLRDKIVSQNLALD